MADYRGRTLLIVNVASRCGYTPQYTGLQALYEKYRDTGFAVLGFPCDQFLHQEPGNTANTPTNQKRRQIKNQSLKMKMVICLRKDIML